MPTSPDISLQSFIREMVLAQCMLSFQSDENEEIIDCLSCLRILTRDEKCVDQLASDSMLEILFSHAFPSHSQAPTKSMIEALKGISNVVYQRPKAIVFLKSKGIVQSLVDRLKQHAIDKEHTDVLSLDMKLCFLLTSLEQTIRVDMLENHQTFDCLADLLSSLQASPLTTTNCQLISEIFRAAYNFGYAIQRDSTSIGLFRSQFDRYCDLIRDLLLRPTLTDGDHSSIVRQMVNFLNVLPRRCFSRLVVQSTQTPVNEAESMRAVQVLINFLSDQLPLVDATDHRVGGSPLRLDETLCPILNALIRAIQGSRLIRKYCRVQILPHLDREVRQLPEEGSTIRNRMCKLLTYPLHGVSELIALFVFILCKEDIERAIKYTGFGNFAGFLARHALLGGSSKKRNRSESTNSTSNANGGQLEGEKSNNSNNDDDSFDEYSSESSSSDTEEYTRLRDDVNPVTGRWEAPRPNPMDGMSEEQKEFITMELVQKIDQLQRSGLIQPGTVGEDGRVRPVEHVLELLDNAPDQTTTGHRGDGGVDNDESD